MDTTPVMLVSDTRRARSGPARIRSAAAWPSARDQKTGHGRRRRRRRQALRAGSAANAAVLPAAGADDRLVHRAGDQDVTFDERRWDASRGGEARSRPTCQFTTSHPMKERVASSVATRRFAAPVARTVRGDRDADDGGEGCMASSQAVARRTREFGIRLALGAPLGIRRPGAPRGLELTAVGALGGLLLSLALDAAARRSALSNAAPTPGRWRWDWRRSPRSAWSRTSCRSRARPACRRRLRCAASDRRRLSRRRRGGCRSASRRRARGRRPPDRAGARRRGCAPRASRRCRAARTGTAAA